VDCIRILQAWGAYDRIEHNKNESFMLFGKNRIDFLGLDNPEKIKGAEYTHIWLEEATDFDLEDVRQLRLRLGRNKANENARYIFTFNPIDAQHWTWTDLVQVEKPGRVVHLSTYRDNIRNLSPEWIADLLALAEQDENYYRIYALGEPGILQNVIYTNYRVADYPVPYPDCVGIDFGYNNATAITGIKQLSDRLQVWEILYQSRMTNTDLIAWLKARAGIWYISGDTPLYADSAEPNRIEEIRRAGFNARPGRQERQGHPDKICDQISDAILDAALTDDPSARVACEVMVSTGLVMVAGEITTDSYIDIPQVVRETIQEIGYTDRKLGLMPTRVLF